MVGGGMDNKIKNIKKHEIESLISILIIIVLLNVIGSFFFTRFDLTSEKSYSISTTSKEILKDLDDNVFLRVYLEGDLPADYKILRKETKEMLDEFRAYSKFIDYEFINPTESNDATERAEVEAQLQYSGLIPQPERIITNNGYQQITIWPGIILNYGGKETAIDLLMRKPGEQFVMNDNNLEKLIQNIEYNLISAIKEISIKNRKTVAFVNGHGELSDPEVYDIVQSLKKKYLVKRATLNEHLNALMKREFDNDSNIVIKPAYDAIIIAKPTEPFSEKDKFIIDQYIMYGGKVMWLIDPINASMDSLKYSESTWGLANNLNLDDQLFKYGVRLNKNLRSSFYYCAGLAITEQYGGSVQTNIHPWYYFPLLFPASDNPILIGVDPVKADFASSLETTTSSPEITKTPLLKTSDYTKIESSPVKISLSSINLQYEIKSEQDVIGNFPQKGQTTAYLLSGTFTSLYENRMPEEITESSEIGFKTKSEPNSMIVIADGDMIRNQFANTEYSKRENVKVGTPLTLGLDQYTGVLYGNKTFILNALSYILKDNNDLMNIKARSSKIYLIDTNKVNKNSVEIQVINVVLPSALMIILGITLAIIRKHKYNKTNTQSGIKSWKRNVKKEA